MRSFFKMFFAALLAMLAFYIIIFIFFVGMIGALASGDKPEIARKSVLVIDLGQHFAERADVNPLGALSQEQTETPGLYDVVRLIRYAKGDKNISGIYLIANGNNNGFAASEELRNAINDFRSSKKFVFAYGEIMTQKAYMVASAADKVYVNPMGVFEWQGFNVSLLFLKGTLDKLKIEPQIFYAGKFKSATEPLRATEMTPENELQTKEWLGDIYSHFLVQVANSRKMDTATLHAYANTYAIRTPADALKNRLIDGVKYDDQLKEEMKKNLKLEKNDKIAFLSLNKYAEAADYKKSSGGRVALIYAEGVIVDGKGDRQSIGSDAYVKLVRRARMDKSVKAVVFRINSGGGSAMASENIWRELTLTRASKPVVVSFGDVAASGGYYIGVAGDSIFAQPNTITGSIGVFGVLPNMEGFFRDKLGITFDGVKTANYADLGAVYRPLHEEEKGIIQSHIDLIYLQFKQRVAEGRKRDIAYVDSVAQGRVWSGEDAVRLGLVDKLGGLQAAIDCAARMAKLDKYRLREYPEKESWINELLGRKDLEPASQIRKEIGEDNFRIYQEIKSIREMTATPQARLPFTFLTN